MTAERRPLEQGDVGALKNLKYVFDHVEHGVAVFITLEAAYAKQERERSAASNSLRARATSPSRR